MMAMFLWKVAPNPRLTTLWGFLLSLGQVWWLTGFMVHHLGLSPALAICAPLLLAAYIGMLCGALAYATCALLPHRASVLKGILVAVCILYIIPTHALFFLPGIRGYLPFAFHHAYAPYLVKKRIVSPHTWVACKGVAFAAITPRAQTRGELHYRIYMSLHSLPPCPKERGFVVTPESCFPFEINDKSPEIKSWQQALPDGCVLMLCCTRRADDGHHYQSILCIDKVRITKHYDKINLVEGFETLSPYNPLKLSSSPFLMHLSKNSFSCGTKESVVFELQDSGEKRKEGRHKKKGAVCAPFLCSDIFYPDKRRGDLALICMKTCWFPQPVASWLMRAAMMRSVFDRREIIAI